MNHQAENYSTPALGNSAASDTLESNFYTPFHQFNEKQLVKLMQAYNLQTDWKQILKLFSLVES